MDATIKTIKNNLFKIRLFKTKNTDNTFAYGGYVYYKNKFIKFIPALTGKDELEKIKKYSEYLLLNLKVNEYGITKPVKNSNEIEYYHIFPEFEHLFNY
jgi:hypothetical protein